MAGNSRGLRANAFGALRTATASAVGHGGLGLGAPTFTLACQTVAGTASYKVVENSPIKFRVLDAYVICTTGAGAGDTFNVENGTDPITNDMDPTDSTDKAVTRATTIDDAYYTIAKGGDLNVTTASGAVGLVIITCCVEE